MKNKDSVNVFADLNLPNPEEHLLKAKLAMQINLIIKQKNLSQTEAAELLDTDQAKISALHKGKLTGFSLERLFKFLNMLGQSIAIKITSKPKTKKLPDISVNLQRIKYIPKNTKTTTRASIMAKKK